MSRWAALPVTVPPSSSSILTQNITDPPPIVFIHSNASTPTKRKGKEHSLLTSPSPLSFSEDLSPISPSPSSSPFSPTQQLSSPSSPNLFCVICRKQFGSLKTFEAHMLSAKHKRAAQSATTSGSSVTKSSPQPKGTFTSPSKKTDDEKKLLEAVGHLHDADRCRSQPNKASMLYFKAAKAFAELGRIREAATTFDAILSLQMSSYQCETISTDSNIKYIADPAKLKLLYTCHLFLGRIARNYDLDLATHHFSRAVHTLFSQEKIKDLMNENITSMSLQYLLTQIDLIVNHTFDAFMPITILSTLIRDSNGAYATLNEIAGFLYPLHKALVLYLIAMKIAIREERLEEAAVAAYRGAKVAWALDMPWIGIDLCLEASKFVDNETLDHQSYLSDALYGAIILYDRVRISNIVTCIDHLNAPSERLRLLVTLAKITLWGGSALDLEDAVSLYQLDIIDPDRTLRQIVQKVSNRLLTST